MGDDYERDQVVPIQGVEKGKGGHIGDSEGWTEAQEAKDRDAFQEKGVINPAQQLRKNNREVIDDLQEDRCRKIMQQLPGKAQESETLSVDATLKITAMKARTESKKLKHTFCYYIRKSIMPNANEEATEGEVEDTREWEDNQS